MLTKTQIEAIESVYCIERASFGRLDVALSSDEVAELRRLALLGLEVDRDVQVAYLRSGSASAGGAPMTRRRIVMDLGTTTTKTCCGNCPMRSLMTCDRYGRLLVVGSGPILRHEQCRADEVSEVWNAGPIV